MTAFMKAVAVATAFSVEGVVRMGMSGTSGGLGEAGPGNGEEQGEI